MKKWWTRMWRSEKEPIVCAIVLVAILVGCSFIEDFKWKTCIITAIVTVVVTSIFLFISMGR